VAKALVYTQCVLLMGSGVAAYNDDNADCAGYVALEHITGTVHGRAGGFSRLHLGAPVASPDCTSAPWWVQTRGPAGAPRAPRTGSPCLVRPPIVLLAQRADVVDLASVVEIMLDQHGDDPARLLQLAPVGPSWSEHLSIIE
jgi:hypothetical protein